MRSASDGATAVDLSLVIPVYNEVESLPALLEAIAGALAEIDLTAEVVAVDAGSTDGSFQVLEELAGRYPFLSAIRFRRNYQKAAALSAGFLEARGEIVITMDADLQDDPREIPNLLAALEGGLDLVSGWKKERRDRSVSGCPLSSSIGSPPRFRVSTSTTSTAGSRPTGARWSTTSCPISTGSCTATCRPSPTGLDTG